MINDENNDFLRKVEVCAPELDSYLSEYQGQHFQEANQSKHKEQYESFIKRFLNDCKTLRSNISLNPFSSTSQFHKLSSRAYIYPEVITNDSKKVFSTGKWRCAVFFLQGFLFYKRICQYYG